MTEAAQCLPHLREMLIAEGGRPAADGGIRFSKERFIGDPYSLFGLLRGVEEDLVVNGIQIYTWAVNDDGVKLDDLRAAMMPATPPVA